MDYIMHINRRLNYFLIVLCFSHNYFRYLIHRMNPGVSKLSWYAFNYVQWYVKYKTAKPPQSFGYVQLKKQRRLRRVKFPCGIMYIYVGGEV